MFQIHNTLTRQKEEFKPLQAGKVGLYVCGVTVYDFCHLGHARCYITFDLIYRYLLHKGYEVTFVKNFTDIDDKIIDKSLKEGTPWQDITKRFIQAYNEDMAALGIKEPNHTPKATENIDGMIRMIETLIQKGRAYASGGDVFYAIREFKEYGKLSGKNIEDLESGARVQVNESKRDPLDFALWKAAKPGEPYWDSPWGKGRPGWHIECSVMSTKYLGESFDIHGGGRDLIFPHHENEIAQSEGCTDKPFAKYWLHNGFVNIDEEKMSKSLGNFLTIRSILEHYPAEVIRLFILSSHYRSPLNYTQQDFENAASGLERFYETMTRVENLIQAGCASDQVFDLETGLQGLKSGFLEAMDDDFNSAKVVGLVFEQVRLMNKALDEGRVSLQEAKLYQNTMIEISEVLGVFGSDSQLYLKEYKQKALASEGISEDQIKSFIEQRKVARAAKDFSRADQIRDDLASKGIILKDNPDGTTGWTVK